MESKKRTRLRTFTHMTNLIGPGRDLLPSELPTLRDILRYGLLLREQSSDDARNYPAAVLARDIYSKVLEKWEQANSSFGTPVVNSRVTILNKIRESWDRAKNISLGRGKLDVKETFTVKLDKLFDILNCKCQIVLCAKFGCPASCKKEAHISCTCPKETKIPLKELAFVKSQRDKIGSFGSHKIGLPDVPEQKRLVKRQKQQDNEIQRLAKYKQKSIPDI